MNWFVRISHSLWLITFAVVLNINNWFICGTFSRLGLAKSSHTISLQAWCYICCILGMMSSYVASSFEFDNLFVNIIPNHIRMLDTDEFYGIVVKTNHSNRPTHGSFLVDVALHSAGWPSSSVWRAWSWAPWPGTSSPMRPRTWNWDSRPGPGPGPPGNGL